MIKLRTEINQQDYPFSIKHTDYVYAIGSCFAENIHKKLDYYKYSSNINSHGILFDPLSIFRSINDLIEGTFLTKEDLFFHNDLWHSYDHHSSFSDIEMTDCLDKINNSIIEDSAFLLKSNTLIITLGSAFAYKKTSDNNFVANCHKIPQTQFKKELLTISQIVTDAKIVLDKLKAFNPNLNIIWTVSPVRHTKDGIVENQRSKSTLILACNEIVNHYDNCYYFPSYEIMMDDLRDYRFYERDLIHPNELAIDYIWQIFMETLLSKQDEDLRHKIDQIQKDKAHRPFNTEGESYSKFKSKLTSKIKELEKGYEYMVGKM